MVFTMTFTEEAHLKEIDESTRPEPLRAPPAIKRTEDLEGETPSPASDSDVESGNRPIFSEWNSADDAGNPRN